MADIVVWIYHYIFFLRGENHWRHYPESLIVGLQRKQILLKQLITTRTVGRDAIESLFKVPNLQQGCFENDRKTYYWRDRRSSLAESHKMRFPEMQLLQLERNSIEPIWNMKEKKTH